MSEKNSKQINDTSFIKKLKLLSFVQEQKKNYDGDLTFLDDYK